jgi:hypothetical protein
MTFVCKISQLDEPRSSVEIQMFNPQRNLLRFPENSKRKKEKKIPDISYYSLLMIRPPMKVL